MAWGQTNNTSLISNTIKQLKENSIQSLFLIPAFVPINESNVIEFKNGLSENTSLTELYMHGHQLGQEGLLEIGKCIENHPNLKTISIGSSDIGLNDKEFELLLSGVLKSKVLKNIDFSKQSINTNSLKIIRNIMENVSAGNGGEPNKNLVYLNFGENLLDSESLNEMEGIIKLNENIETLNIAGNTIGGGNVQNGVIGGISESFITCLIEHGKKLKKLVLSANPLSDDNSCQQIARLLINHSSLVEIELNDCEISQSGALALGESLIKWKGHSFTATGNPMIKHSLTSSWANVSPTITTTHGNHHHHHTISNNIKHLSLRGCFIGDEGISGIIHAISNGLLPSLTLLDVAFNKLTLESLNSLGDLVKGKHVNSLEYLDASFNMFGRETKSFVCEWIKSNGLNNKLKCLSLNNTGMKFMDTWEICKTLAENINSPTFTSLKLLELMGNDERDQEQQQREEAQQQKIEERQSQEHNDNHEDQVDVEQQQKEEDVFNVYDSLAENIQKLQNEKKLDFKWK